MLQTVLKRDVGMEYKKQEPVFKGWVKFVVKAFYNKFTRRG